MANSVETRVKAVMADILQIDPARIGSKATMETLPGWDSVNHIQLVSALEQEFDVMFEVAEIETMVSFAELTRVLQRRLAT